MTEPIGIDTHGLADPPDIPDDLEWASRLEEIEAEIEQLVDEHIFLAMQPPFIAGYRTFGEYRNLRRLLADAKREIVKLQEDLTYEWQRAVDAEADCLTLRDAIAWRDRPTPKDADDDDDLPY